MNTAKSVTHVLKMMLFTSLLLAAQLAYAGIAGHVQFLNGNVQITNSVGQSRALQKGDAIHESDTVFTDKQASAQIKMRDGGYVVIRPESQLKFDSFIFSGQEDGNEKSFFSLLKGGIRAITGLIGQKNKQSYRITTPDATIGIRGTDHETIVVIAGSAQAATTPVGTYNKVNLGETTMTTAQGTISVLPNQMGYAGGAAQMPVLQPLNLNLFTVATAPSPAAQSGRADVRARVAVDNTLQEQGYAPESQVPTNTLLRPITNSTAGGTQPALVF